MSAAKGTILLTGANGGIGVGFVTQLLKSPYGTTHQAVYTVRDPAKAHALNATLKKAPKDHEHQVLALDLTSLDAVRTFARDINKQVTEGSLPPIQALILNAGIQDNGGEYFTRDGFERTFAVNYLANFLLVLLILESMDKQHGRIIYIGSTGASIDWQPNAGNFTSESQKTTLITTPERMAKGVEEVPDGDVFKTGMRRYAMSKLLMMMWMYELQRRLDTDSKLSHITVLGLDPGWIGGTGVVRNSPFAVKFVLAVCYVLGFVISLFSSNPLIRTASKNGDDMLRVSFDTKAFGEYPKAAYVNGSVLSHTPKQANDEEQQKAIWKGSLGFASIKKGDTVLENWG